MGILSFGFRNTSIRPKTRATAFRVYRGCCSDKLRSNRAGSETRIWKRDRYTADLASSCLVVEKWY